MDDNDVAAIQPKWQTSTTSGKYSFIYSISNKKKEHTIKIYLIIYLIKLI